MEFQTLLSVVGEEPVFETGLLLAGDVDPNHIRRQLSRWQKAGKIIQLRRSLYSLAAPYQKVTPHPFVVANHMVRGSYVSLHAALAHYGLIPEYVATITSITTARPGQWSTPLGNYKYHHVKPTMFFGYRQVTVHKRQSAFVATAEKALLDLIYLRPGGEKLAYLQSLRLQALEQLDLDTFRTMVTQVDSPKLQRALAALTELVTREVESYETL